MSTAPRRSKPAGPPTNLYRQIVESARDGIWIHDLDGTTTYANAQMADLLGYPLAEMADLTLFDLLDDEGQEQARGMLDRERRTPLNEQVDCRYLRKDGSAVWCLVSRSPLLDDDGRHIGSINLVSDISERTRVDEQLRHSGELLAEAQRVAHLGSWSWDLGTDVIEWTDEMYRILGVARGPESAGPTYQGYLDQVHPQDRGLVEAGVERCLSGAPTFSYECRIVRPGGREIWVQARGEAVRDAAGAVSTLRGTLLDVTAYKSAQEEEQRTSSRYQLLQTMTSAANKDLRLERVLEVAVRKILLHTGWPQGQAYTVTGQPPRLVPAPTASGSDHARARGHGGRQRRTTALATEVLASARAQWLRPTPAVDGAPPEQPSGRPELVTGFAFPVLVEGEVVAVLEFLSDAVAVRDEELLETCEQVATQLARVVERRRAADDLASAIDAALGSLRAKSEFLAMMSHEIRTPMNGVIGLTNLLLDTQLDERQRQYAEGVHVSGEALLTVINDILDFSKLEAGKVELDYEDFDVRRVMDEVAGLLAPAAYSKGVELLAHCWPDVPGVLVGDSGRIRQVLLNFVSNGVKFTAEGEVLITFTARPLDDERVGLRLEVSDTGIGIPEQHRDRLFESFSQADASTTRRYGGTGLGLAISQRLVEAMGGTIGFDSEVGAGTTFWCEIPLALGSAPAGHPLSPPPNLLTGLRVLVVDDNATNRMILESQLRTWELRPESVDSAAAALVRMRTMAARGEPYGLAVLDMCMPDVDGLELAQQVSADEVLSATPMMMLTSTSELEPATLARAGVGDWLLKPVRSSDLYVRLLRLMAPVVRRQPSVPPPAAGDTPVGSPPRGRVLVVEDNPLNQLVAEGIIASLGYTVDTVDNGAEALRAILNTSYAAVLMDCHMPVMDGYEATREIRRREGGTQRVPVIAMTAGAMSEDRERCAAAGMDDFVAKPVTQAAVGSALARWVRAGGDEPGGPVAAGASPRSRLVGDDEPALDPNRITQLRQLGSMSGADLLGRVVQLFARDGTAGLETIREAVSSHAVTDLDEALHKLKGTSANVGANRVAALCAKLEEATADPVTRGDTTAPLIPDDLLRELESELGDANRAIAQAVAAEPAVPPRQR